MPYYGPHKPVVFVFVPMPELTPGMWSKDALPSAPSGWRWLRSDEDAEVGDLCCQPSVDPVLINTASVQRPNGKIVAWGPHPNNHPCLRRVTSAET